MEKQRRSIGKTIIKILLLIILSFASGIGGAYWMMHLGTGVVINTTESTVTTTDSKDATAIAEKMTKSVVAITTEKMTTDNFWFGSQVQSGAGSGVIISEDGYILTCAHVINGASKIQVTTYDNETYTAKLIGSYTNGDIAVIKIEANKLSPATFANTDNLKQGQTTYAVGNPEGTFSDSITSGIVSALNREIQVNISEDDDGSSYPFGGYSKSNIITLNVIQTDAAVSPGNSGGGLFNANGELIGIVNAKSTDTGSEGLGFAIYGNTARKIAQSLISKGSYNE